MTGAQRDEGGGDLAGDVFLLALAEKAQRYLPDNDGGRPVRRRGGKRDTTKRLMSECSLLLERVEAGLRYNCEGAGGALPVGIEVDLRAAYNSVNLGDVEAASAWLHNMQRQVPQYAELYDDATACTLDEVQHLLDSM